MEALRDLADNFNVLHRRDAAFEALKANVGRQAQAPRPRALGKSAAEGPNDRPTASLPEHAGEDEVWPGGNGRLHPGGAVEPLTSGDDKNFVVTTNLGNKFARWTGSPQRQAFGKSVFLATHLQALDELAPPSSIIAGTLF